MERSSQVHEAIADQSETLPPVGQHDVELLGEPLAASASAVHPQAIPARPRGPVTTANVLRLLDWQGFQCALTGRLLTPDAASLDHIIPLRDGGEHTIENAQVLHKAVNRAKGTLTNEQFIQLCREVVAYADGPAAPTHGPGA
jgi:hypothetical protein